MLFPHRPITSASESAFFFNSTQFFKCCTVIENHVVALRLDSCHLRNIPYLPHTNPIGVMVDRTYRYLPLDDLSLPMLLREDFMFFFVRVTGVFLVALADSSNCVVFFMTVIQLMQAEALHLHQPRSLSYNYDDLRHEIVQRSIRTGCKIVVP